MTRPRVLFAVLVAGTWGVGFLVGWLASGSVRAGMVVATVLLAVDVLVVAVLRARRRRATGTTAGTGQGSRVRGRGHR